MTQEEKVRKIFERIPNLKTISDSKYELSLADSASGRQITVNRRSRRISFWIEADFELEQKEYSDSFEFRFLDESVPRVHMAANRLVGPYRGRQGTRAYYVKTDEISDLEKLVGSYFGDDGFFDPNSQAPSELFPEEISAEKKIYEGARIQISVNVYERDRNAREKCIAHWGCTCAVCDFDFKHKYGDIGEGFIHVHHLKQLSEIGAEYELDPIADLRPVCPNCHTMIHRKKRALSILELKSILADIETPKE